MTQSQTMEGTRSGQAEKGAVKVHTYLFFNGQCEEAFKFYEECLGGQIQAMMTPRGTPMEDETPGEWHNMIMHACLSVGDQMLMGSDCPPDQYSEPKGFSVHLSVETPAEAERIFHALSAAGRVTMPLEQTFWATRFGMLVDQFGTPWMISCSGDCVADS